jgi:two-component system sensor histidine kinase YesM
MILSRVKKISSRITFGIKLKLFLSYTAVIIVPVMIGALLPYTYTERIILKETDESLRFTLDNIAESISYKMQKYIGISNKLIASTSNISRYISADYSENTAEANYAAHDINTRLTDEIRSNNEEILNIRIYKNNSSMPNYGDYILDIDDYKDTDWYKGVNSNRGVSYWKNGEFKRTGYPVIKTVSIISRFNSLQSLELLEIELRQDKIFGNILKFRYKENTMIGVVDQKGNVIVTNNLPNNRFTELVQFIWKKSAAVNNTSFLEKIDGEDYLVISKELNFQGWQVVSIVPVRGLRASINTIKLVTLITAVSCIILFLFITVFLSNLMTNRIQKLTRKMRSVQEGNFNVSMKVSGNDEISEMTGVFNSMVESIRNLINEVYKGRIEKKEAELRALQEQINPHFLYNTLMSINWIAVQVNAPKIVDIVQLLATFYRLSLSKGREIIPLKDEFAQVKAYVSIQKIRYEDSFEAFFEVEPGLEEAQVIKFIIQPFVENAIIHGFNENMKGSIYITAKRTEDNDLLIRVIDNGKGMRKEMLEAVSEESGRVSRISRREEGYGIRNVNERIRLHYGETYGVSIFSEHESGTIVEIKLPLDLKGKEDAAC